MPIVDKHNNLHAADGKFTNKLPKPESATQLGTRSTKEKLRFDSDFDIVSARNSKVRVSAPSVPPWPASLPEPEINFGFDDEGRVFMCIKNPETGAADFFSKDSYEDLNESYTYLDLDQRAAVDEWVNVVFSRGRQVASALAERAVPEETFTQISDFAQGYKPECPAENETNQNRSAALMQDALSAYLDPTLTPEDQNTGLADVLANLRHYSEKHGLNFETALRRTADYFDADNEEDQLVS